MERLMSPRAFRSLYPEFDDPSWATWNGISDLIHSHEPANPNQVFELTGCRSVPELVREVFGVKGRGGGGTRWCAREVVYSATSIRWPHAVGEIVVCGLMAPDRRQSAVALSYIGGFLKSVPHLADLIVDETKETITLSTNVLIEVVTANAAAPRGRTYAMAVVDEAGFLPPEGDDSGQEVIRALRPALARIDGSKLLCIGSPYREDSILSESMTWPHDDRVVRFQADTLTLNPTFDQSEIDRAFRHDPVSAWSEYGRDGEIRFRSDVASFLLDSDVLAALVPAGVRVVPPSEGAVVAHFDAATGSSVQGADRAALAVAKVGDPVELLVSKAWSPPFSPSAVAGEVAALLDKYGVTELSIDRFAPGLVADIFRHEGMTCWAADQDTSTAFAGLLTLLNSGTVRLLDDPLLLKELGTLERKPLPSGRDRIGHRPGAHDDQAAAVAFAVTKAASLSAHPLCGLCSDPNCRGWCVWDGHESRPQGSPSALEEKVLRDGFWMPGM